jgi:O-antigen ligase
MFTKFQTQYYKNPLLAQIVIAAGLSVLGVGIGLLLGFAGPVITTIVLLILPLFWLALTSLEVAFASLLVGLLLLPFGTMPFKIILTPTFLDITLGGVVGIYLLQWMAGYRRRLALTPAHGLLLMFLLWALIAFLVGKDNGPLTPNILRKFAEFLLSIFFVWVVVDYCQTRAQLQRALWVLMLAGTLAAAVALILYLLPVDVSQRVLDQLRVIGYYPNGGGIRYIEDNPDLAQRAIGFWVDPNALGGVMAMFAALLAPQLVANQPLLRPRWFSWGAFGLVALVVLLTFSRAAMVALAVALLFIAAFRYRSLLIVLAVGAILIMVLPWTQAYVLRFVEGVQGQDLATQMRFGEYKDALILISRYPIFGVGFSGAPDVDVYLGVSNAYLLLMQEMGIVGLGIFALLMLVVFGWGILNRKVVLQNPQYDSLWLGLYAGISAALVIGIFDHYFFNLEFHASQTVFWLFIGLSLAVVRLASAKNQQK